MRKSVFVLAVIGAACSSVAFAAEVKKDKAYVPTVKATTMSDAQMDKVTAGGATHENLITNNGQDFIGMHNHNNFNCHNDGGRGGFSC